MSSKIIVCQTGSRHRYLIPRVLENKGLLYRLYTDSTRYSLLGRLASFLLRHGVRASLLKKLDARDPSLQDMGKLRTTDIYFIKDKLLSFLPRDGYRRIRLLYHGFENKCVRWGLGESDCIYSMYFENMKFLRLAKSKGVKVVVDIYETPMTYEYLLDELKQPEYAPFSGMEKEYRNKHRVRMEHINEILSLADYYTIPSKFVAKSMSVFESFDKNKVIFLPYASSITPGEYNYTPVRHRVIFVGNDPMRKGLLYCARAATELKKKYKDLDFRVIGSGNERLIGQEAFKDLNFIGVVDRNRLMQEYSSAEAYVFPTLFEGFAGTVIEAASCGCPIITTENAGTDVDEFPAVYIPEKDVESIVRAVENIFENPQFRDELSKKVFEYSRNLSPTAYEERMYEVFSKI